MRSHISFQVLPRGFYTWTKNVNQVDERRLRVPSEAVGVQASLHGSERNHNFQ